MAKYSEEQVVVIENFASKYSEEIPYAEFLEFHKEFVEEYDETYTTRSLGAKIRHMNFKVQPKGKVNAPKSYTPEEEAKIQELCNDPDNLPYLEHVAEVLGRETKSISGKLVSMGIYGIKKMNPKEPAKKLFTEADEAVINEMCADEENMPFIEDLADKLGYGVSGKLAGMRIKGVKTRNSTAVRKAKIYTEEMLVELQADVTAGKTVGEIAEERSLNERGLYIALVKNGILEKKGKEVFWTPERNGELKTLVEEGKSRTDIAVALNTTIMVVAKQAKKFDLEFVEAA